MSFSIFAEDTDAICSQQCIQTLLKPKPWSLCSGFGTNTVPGFAAKLWRVSAIVVITAYRPCLVCGRDSSETGGWGELVGGRGGWLMTVICLRLCL